MRFRLLTCCFMGAVLWSSQVSGMTLGEVISGALVKSYSIQGQAEVVKSTQFSYISTIDPYLPRVDIDSAYTRYLNGRFSASTTSSSILVSTSRDIYSFFGVASLLLFDGGERYAVRKGAFYLVEKERARLDGVRTDVIFLAKASFFTALGKRAVVEKRKEAVAIAQRTYDLTKARYGEGIVKKSDLLQSEVRLTTTKIELYNAEIEYEKALEDVKSLLLVRPLEALTLDGELSEPSRDFDMMALIESAMKVRPDVVAQVKEVDRLGTVYDQRRSKWFPRIEAQLAQTRQDRSFFPNNRQDTFGINFSYPLFDGVGRYYNMQAAKSDIMAGRFRLQEIRRNVELEIVQALKDYERSRKDVTSLAELLREATSNFNQAYGEYQYGKGDILTLLQSEKDLARAKENLVIATYQSNNALALVEKLAYLTD